jgi:hypothetical protein
MAQVGITARVIATGKTEVHVDARWDAAFKGPADNPGGGVAMSLVVAPIYAEEGGDGERRVIGVLQVVNKNKAGGLLVTCSRSTFNLLLCLRTSV